MEQPITNQTVECIEYIDAWEDLKRSDLHMPEVGDMFSSRAAQKGTEGIQYDTDDVADAKHKMPFCTDDTEGRTYHYVCPDIPDRDALIKSLGSSLDLLFQFCDAVLRVNTTECCMSQHYCSGAEKYVDETTVALAIYGVRFCVRFESPRGSCDVTYVTCIYRDKVIYDKCAEHCC